MSSISAGLGFSKAGRTSSKRAKTLSKEQQPLAGELGQFLLGQVGEGLPRYEGPLYEPMSAEQLALLGGWGEPLKAYGGFPTSVADAYQEAISGAITPGASEGEISRYLEARRAPLERRFEEETIPALRKTFRGPGTYWGGVRAKEETKERARFQEGLTAGEEAFRFEARQHQIELEEAARARQLTAATSAAGIFERAMGQAVSGEEAKRMDIQRQNVAAYEEWMRTLPELNPLISQALAFLGTPMTAVAFYTKGTSWAGAVEYGGGGGGGGDDDSSMLDQMMSYFGGSP